jgi:hypothetical protein
LEAGTVPEKAVISHRGEKYEIGRGKRFYGIWVVGAPYEAPVDRWPETRDGWEQAWTRFATVEVPGTIGPVQSKRPGLGAMLKSRRAAAAGPGAADGSAAASDAATAGRRGGTALLVGEGLLVLGVVLGLAGLFPAYVGGQSLLSQGDQVVPHLVYVIAWAISAGPIALSVSRPRAARLGALFALGLSAVTFGLFFSDVGEVVSSGASLGTGLVVSLLGWLACTAGAAIALVASCRDQDSARPGPAGVTGSAQSECGWPAKPSRNHLGALGLLVLAGIGTAAAFAPSWDSYTLVSSTLGTTQTITEGNAFSYPGVMIAGEVVVMVAVVAVAALAALWRPARQGALLLAGAIVPLAAQAVSALIQASGPATPATLGIPAAQVSAYGLTVVSSGVTPIFWVYCVFVVSLLVSCAWLLTTPGRPAVPASPWAPSSLGDAGRVPVDPAAEPVSDAADADPTAAPADADPIDAAPADADPIDADPIDADPIDADPIDADADPEDAEPADPKTADAGTADSQAVDSEMTHTGPAVGDPAAAEGGPEGGQSAYA